VSPHSPLSPPSAYKPVVFDMDGVLIDSKAYVQSAYHFAGVEMPDGAWGRPWKDWLVDACGGDLDKATTIHRAKNETYMRILEAGTFEELPGSHVAHTLQQRGVPVHFLTSASVQVARMVINRLDLGAENIIGSGCALEDKVRILNVRPIPGYYVDDHHILGLEICARAEWDFVPYYTYETTYDDLLEQLWKQ
jgi:hypothetical protein